jgi:soluble lytic murein transglycosylase-like protein
MKLNFSAKEDIGEQKGQLRPVSRFMSKILIVLAVTLAVLPSSASAAGFIYLKNNAPTYIEKTKQSYGEMVNIASMLHDYDKNLILAVIVIESEGRTEATSHKGAQGLMQLMPETAKSMGVKDSKDPFQNILAGTKYLRQLEDLYGFDSPQEALVAYNMGPSRAHRWLSQYSAEDYGYVAKVMYVYGILAQQDKEKEQLATSIQKRMAAEVEASTGTAPFMTKPRSLSLSSFPMTLPNNRKEETE